MKLTVSLAAMIAAFLTYSSTLNAAEHSLSLGYTQAKLDSVKLHGADIKYRFEWGSPWSVISSLSFQTKEIGNISAGRQAITSGSGRVKMASLMAGPALRFNEFFSLYGLAGLNKVRLNQQWKMNRTDGNGTLTEQQFTDTFQHLSPVISLGTQINPLSSVVVDFSYSVARPKVGDTRYNLNVLSLGVGVKF